MATGVRFFGLEQRRQGGDPGGRKRGGLERSQLKSENGSEISQMGFLRFFWICAYCGSRAAYYRAFCCL